MSDTDNDECKGRALDPLCLGGPDDEESRGWYGSWLDENAESPCSVESSSESEFWPGTGEPDGPGYEAEDLSLRLSATIDIRTLCSVRRCNNVQAAEGDYIKICITIMFPRVRNCFRQAK